VSDAAAPKDAKLYPLEALDRRKSADLSVRYPLEVRLISVCWFGFGMTRVEMAPAPEQAVRGYQNIYRTTAKKSMESAPCGRHPEDKILRQRASQHCPLEN
jgi:hypothetical protein